MKKTSVIILAAGVSSRMGKDKRSLYFNNGKRFLDQLISEYWAAGITDIVIVHQAHMNVEPYLLNHDIHLIPNHHISKGRNWSIYLGLQHLLNTNGTFLQNVDNPFTTRALITKMLENTEKEQILIPQYLGQNAHPIYLPSSYISEFIRSEFSQFDFRQSLLSWPKKAIPWHQKEIRANINSPEDYFKWFGRSIHDVIAD